MRSSTERRNSERHINNFLIEVRSKNKNRDDFIEKTILQNISGSGGYFTTKKKENYYLGQSVKISIFLPGNIDIKAKMDGTGTVIRIEQFSNIAIRFDTPISLQRYDK
jgi:hypothetical protein